MFEFVRRNTKLFAAPLFLLIIVAFVLVGVDSYKGFVTKGATVAKVDGQSISQEELDQQHKIEVDRIRASGANIDPKILDSDAAKNATLERIIQNRVVTSFVRKNNLTTTDVQLATELQKIPAIASLKKSDGSLDYDQYKNLLASQGMTPAAFEAQFRSELTAKQVFAVLASTGFNTQAYNKSATNAYLQERDVELKYFVPKDYLSQVSVSEDERKSYFEAHKDAFKSEESVDVEYVLLNSDVAAKQSQFSDADLRAYYDKNQSQWATKEQRRASHILIAVSKDASSDEKLKAKNKAAEILSQLRKDSSLFAKLAKQNSDDPGSAAKGGDLDYFTRGAMVKPFEDTVFAMQKNQISDLVESDFGFHIIQLTDIKPSTVPAFDEVRAKLEQELKKSAAQNKFAEMAEQLASAAYEDPQSFAAISKKLGVTPVVVKAITRSSASINDPVVANPKVLDWIFANAAAVKNNSEPIEFAPNALVSVRVIAHQPAALLAYEQAKSAVDKIVSMDKAQQAAGMAAKKQLESIQANINAPFVAVQRVSRANKALAPELIRAMLGVPQDKLPQVLSVDLPNRTVAVALVRKVIPVDASSAFTTGLQQLRSNAEGEALYESLKQRFKVSASLATTK